MSLDAYVLTGRLAEDGQSMELPAFKDGKLVPRYRATLRVQGTPQKELLQNDNLTYLAVPAGTWLELGARDIPIPFKDGSGKILDVRTFGFGGTSLRTEGTTLIKINPGIPFKVTANQGEKYHVFELYNSFVTHTHPDEEHFPFVYDEKQRVAAIERGSRIIQLPGALIFPDYAAFRLPGWLAKEFNGSPEFGFAYSEFKEPRKGEVLHAHQEMMEPYIGLQGQIPLFVATGSGKTSITVNQAVKDGDVEKLVPTTYRGEIVPVGAGDVVLPLPGVAHRIQFDGAQFPFTMYCVNYADRGLDKVPGSDRVVLEK